MAKAKTAPTPAQAKHDEAKAKGASTQDLEQLAANAAPTDDRLLATKGVVARGRTVMTEHGTFTAGQVVTSTKDEIARLRRQKFLVDPRETLLPMGNGPRFFQEDKAAEGAPEPQ